ncbi:conserved hypothetical protein [Bathymodiolus platifrons methanotrophic gill symbiont]|uniref:SMODS domain-containing nucleotidyltransferase n=1 Tax=Bathymodiolus platifrons methanotrophic gill symbiont TaxID=113268 RepID=UPI000B415872|nr:nucleotidyltransferase [Bathymodiolus platifrons methanotrophic gill symbiont]GAW85034.1 conserved hypothetical protein [Bathymodiolus platifrons methanotrophic gill symbiont]GFO74027.1 hypothetical protein BPLS_P0432 [Bathymodiolus platifrons methanotrophic gill symbiont]
MKLDHYLTNFLKDTVNLNQSRIDTLKQRVDTISEFVKQLDEFEDLFIETTPQGSWAHKTIIRPVGNDDFDADLVFFLNENEDWQPKDYIDTLYHCFMASNTYKDMVSRNTRCVTLDYAGDFHLDVIPCIRRDSVWDGETEWILNRQDNSEEQTNPDGYSEWFADKTRETDGYLIKVVRLFKYLRDHKKTFSAKSVLLTTLLGNRIHLFDNLSNNFSDTSTSLQTIFNRLNDYLQENPIMPTVQNPSMPSENFNRHWDQNKYDNFRNCIQRYREWIEDAIAEQDREECILKWRKVFGGDFAKSVIIESRSSGSTIIASEDTSHVIVPPWPIQRVGSLNINASLHSSKEGGFLGNYTSDGPRLKPDTWIHFSANHTFSQHIRIKWQVVNTGLVARLARSLRGDINQVGSDIWEHTEYKGTHWVECFAVDIKKGVCLGKSGRFYVNVS